MHVSDMKETCGIHLAEYNMRDTQCGSTRISTGVWGYPSAVALHCSRQHNELMRHRQQPACGRGSMLLLYIYRSLASSTARSTSRSTACRCRRAMGPMRPASLSRPPHTGVSAGPVSHAAGEPRLQVCRAREPPSGFTMLTCSACELR